MAKSARPNVMMIIADQMAPDVIGALGHPVVKTPHIDMLVRDGVSFTNCYCNSPLCVPSRASMLSGKLPSQIEVYDNGSEFRSSIPTFVHHLRRSAYGTILSGKMHFIGPDQLHGFEQRLTQDLQPTGFELTPDWTRGVYANPGTGVKRLRHPGVCDGNKHLDFDEIVHRRTLRKIQELGQNRVQRPFFLCASYFHPHDPFVITKEYWERYEGVDIPMPDAPPESLETMHPYNQWIQVHHEVDQYRLNEQEVRLNRRAYYGMVSYFDDKVGDILRELERMQLTNNTIIVVVSDHGEMLGEHGMWFKRTLYDPAAKVPLIFSWPGRLAEGRQVEEVVSLVDVGATLMKLADVPEADEWIAEMDGDSFHQLLMGEQADWKNEAFCEYQGEGTIHPMMALRKGKYKLVYIHGEEPLLFDVDNDPHETRNLIKEPAYQKLSAHLLNWVQREFDFEKIETEVLKSQRERLMMLDALQTGTRTKWEHIPPA